MVYDSRCLKTMLFQYPMATIINGIHLFMVIKICIFRKVNNIMEQFELFSIDKFKCNSEATYYLVLLRENGTLKI